MEGDCGVRGGVAGGLNPRGFVSGFLEPSPWSRGKNLDLCLWLGRSVLFLGLECRGFAVVGGLLEVSIQGGYHISWLMERLGR